MKDHFFLLLAARALHAPEQNRFRGLPVIGVLHSRHLELIGLALIQGKSLSSVVELASVGEKGIAIGLKIATPFLKCRSIALNVVTRSDVFRVLML